MRIQPQWKQKYDVLKEYVTENPDIYIDMNEISIPEHLRDEFYKRFDDIRHTIVESCYGFLPPEVDTLGRNYIQSEKELMEILGLERIELPVDLSSFLHNPRESLTRGLFHRLFEMVQGKITADDFERMTESDLTATAEGLFQLGYESWAALTLIRLLEPDEAFDVELDEEYETVVAELKEIAFGRQFHHQTKRIPEFILRSKKTGSYISVKMPLAREVDSYYIPYEIPKKMFRDRTGDTSHVLDSRVMLLSMIQDLKKIPVYVDMGNRSIKEPDLMVEFLTEQNLTDPDVIYGVQRRVEIMKPRLGGSIVVVNPGSDTNIVKPIENIDTFPVGLDPVKFQPVIDKLV